MSVLLTDKERCIKNLPELIEQVGASLKKVSLSLVKPNLCGYYPPSPQLLGAAVRTLEEFSDRIVVGDTDSTIHRADEMFRRRGYSKLEGGKVELRNLLGDEVRWVEVPSPHAVDKLPLPDSALSCGLMLNMPGLGTHGNTKLTCASKNLFGLIASRRKLSDYHPLGVDRVIADICKVIRPTVNLVDAGDDVLLGVDVLNVDFVAAGMIGLDPREVEHLRLIASDRGLDLSDFKVELLRV
jgi:uncharacterized protein (DUF362 family)